MLTALSSTLGLNPMALPPGPSSRIVWAVGAPPREALDAQEIETAADNRPTRVRTGTSAMNVDGQCTLTPRSSSACRGLSGPSHVTLRPT